MSINFSNIERNRNCILGHSTNIDNKSQGQRTLQPMRSNMAPKQKDANVAILPQKVPGPLL